MVVLDFGEIVGRSILATRLVAFLNLATHTTCCFLKHQLGVGIFDPIFILVISCV